MNKEVDIKTQLKGVDEWKRFREFSRKVYTIALQDGLLTKPDRCSSCKKFNAVIHGHHEDYRKPLDIRWLCHSCHSKLAKNVAMPSLQGSNIWDHRDLLKPVVIAAEE